MRAATCSRRKKIGCFATGLRYGAIGRGICLKSSLFKLRQAPKRRQRMLRNNRGAFFRLRFQAAFRRVRGCPARAVSLPDDPIRAPVSEGKICTPVSAVPIPRFRRRRERNGLPFLLPLFRGAVSEVAAELYNCKFCRERASRSWQGALRFWLLLSHYKSSPLPPERNLSFPGSRELFRPRRNAKRPVFTAPGGINLPEE